MTTPTISVVIPVRNEVAAIEAAIKSIIAQEVSGDLEIVVADAMSDDGTREILEGLRESTGRLVVVDNPSGRTAAGLNLAIAASTGEVIVRCDGHAQLEPGYIRRAVELLEETGAAVVGGVQRAVGIDPLQRSIALAMTTPMGVGDAKFHRGGRPGPTDTVYLGVFRRSVLEEVGVYDEAMIRNQDYELNYRIRAAGHTVYFHPDLRVTYRPRGSLRALASQYFQYGRWKRVMLRRNPGATRWRQLVPPTFVAALVASLALLAAGRPVLAALTPAAYVVALLGTVAVELANTRDAAAVGLVVALPMMHVSWGIGFLVGGSKAEPPGVVRLDG